MIDNIDKIRNYLDFSNPDVYYYLEVSRRPKDNPGIVGEEYWWVSAFSSVTDFARSLGMGKELAKILNARLYVSISPRSKEKLRQKIINTKNIAKPGIFTNFYKFNENIIIGAPNEYWQIDIDKVHMPKLDYIREFLRSAEVEIVDEFPSKSGVHIITKPFDADNIFHNGSPYTQQYIFSFPGLEKEVNIFRNCELIAYYPGE